MQYPFQHVAIIGLGLIGSSVARAIKARMPGVTVSGYDSEAAHVRYCKEQSIIDEAAVSQGDAAAEADLVILAIPPSSLTDVAWALSPHLKRDTVVMDVASAKQSVIETLSKDIPTHVSYVPAHPIAGNERSGPEAGEATLFEKRRVILTPEESKVNTPPVMRARQFWEILGAVVECMPAELHDRIYAHVSHLPQLLAYAASDALQGQTVTTAHGETFRQFVRLARSAPALWADILIANKTQLLAALNTYSAVLNQILQELHAGRMSHERSESSDYAATSFFPRIAASCLVMTVNMLEEQITLPLSTYAGTGFADFVSPAIESPEKDIEAISKHYLDVLPILERYAASLHTLRSMIAQGQQAELREKLAAIVGTH